MTHFKSDNFMKNKKRIKNIIYESHCKHILMSWVNEVIASICQLSKDQKRMILASCDRIINSYINTFKIRTNIWQAVALSTIWLTIKAYGIDEEEDEWIDARYISEFCPYVSREQIVNFEMLVFKHLNYEVIGPERTTFLNSSNKKLNF